MKKMIKFVSIVCAMVLLLSVFTSCQKQDTSVKSDNAAEKSSTAADKTASTKPVNMRFSWWGADDRHKATLAAIDLYTQKYPNVKIEGEYGAFGNYYQKLLTQLAGGTAPDIVQIDYKFVHDLIVQGKPFVNMNTMTNKIDMSGLDMKFAKEQCGEGDYLIGLPEGINGMGLIYNVQVLKDAGISIDNNWDWDKLMDAGIKLRQFDKNKNLLFLTNDHYGFLVKTQIKQKTGNNFIKDDYTLGFQRNDIVDVFKYIKDMTDKGVVPPFEESVPFEGVYADQNPNWLSGKYAIFATSASIIPSITKASKFPVDVARYPVPKDAKNPGIITSPSMILSIYNKSANIDEAAKFINWLMNDKDAIMAITDTRGLPAVKNARTILTEAKKVDPNITKMVEEALPFSGGSESPLSTNQEIDTILKDYIHKLGYRKLTPEQAADSLIKDLGDKLKEFKK